MSLLRVGLPLVVAFLVSTLVLVGCDTSVPAFPSTDDPIVPDDSQIASMNVPTGFDYATAENVDLRVEALTRDAQPMATVRFDVYAGNLLLGSGLTDPSGSYAARYAVPSGTGALTVRTDYLGLPDALDAAIEDGSASVRFGGEATGGVRAPLPFPPLFPSVRAQTLVYHSPFDDQGVPTDLVDPADLIDQRLLDAVNAALPERQSVPENTPEYLGDTVPHALDLLQDADVWVTFVHEGAGFKNALGFYTYDLAAPPASPDDVDELRVVFPNTSYEGSGGGLVSGDKVLIGSFEAGTGIGFFIVPDGWRGDRVEPRNEQELLFSNPDFNPEADPALRQHTVLLEVPNRDEIILAFEDIERDRPNCDQDFNDVIFYVTADPADAFDREDLPETPPTKDDRDGDGALDAEDDEPDDPTIATYEYGPGKDQFGTLAYEDLWPGLGDYDFNDLVVDYTLRFGRHADGSLTRLDGRFVVKAIGAAFVNGFALEAPVPASSVASVSGQRLSQGLFSMAGNGTEAGRTRAVIPVFDAAQEILSDPTTFFSNTEAGQPYVPPTDTIKIGVAFAPRIPASESRALSVTWLNPFLVSNQERGREVHLPDLPPTEGADLALFNTSEDESDVEAGLTYKTWNGLPWALHFVGGFVYPFEEVDITRAYPRFKPWAESGGAIDADWYTNPDYRVDQYLYRP